jgi:hypothetical protein
VLRISRVIGIRSYIGEILRDEHLFHLIVLLLFSKTFAVYKDLIRKKLFTAFLKLHFTTDYWIALNKTAFQAVTIHFINKAGQLLKAILALQKHKKSCSSKQQAEALIKVLEEYKIKAKRIGYITSRFPSSASTTTKLSTNYTKYR